MLTTPKKVSIMLAADAGAKIERRDALSTYDSIEWMNDPEPEWDWQHYEFRVKQKPREWWVNTYPLLFRSPAMYKTRELANFHEGGSRDECIHVIEVIEQED